jgi:hypothetical protein
MVLPSTVLAVGYDSGAFFTAVSVPPERVTTADVLRFMTARRSGRQDGLHLAGDQPDRVSARSLCRRLSSVSGLLASLQAGDAPVKRHRRPAESAGTAAAEPGRAALPGTRTLPTILDPAAVDALTAAMCTHQVRAVLAGALSRKRLIQRTSLAPATTRFDARVAVPRD